MTYATFVRRRNFLVAAFLFAMACGNLTLALRLVDSLRNGYQDFTIYYTGARLLREGHAAALYSLRTQYQTQLTFAHVPIRQGPLPYNHPPFEALLFVPFTFLEYWPAYLFWTALNLVMLAASAMLLRQFPKIRALPPLLLGLASVAFFPVAIGLIQGQDTILLLLMVVLALTCLDRGQDVAAGAWLAAGLFRPHMIVPLALLLAARRWKLLLGFAPVALLLAGISVAIMGWSGPMAYVHFVVRVEQTGAGGFGPQAVPNLRGLVGDLPGINSSGHLAGLLIVMSSVIVFALALRRIRSGSDSIGYAYSLASLTTILVSFHALSYDLTLLVPVVICLLAGAVTAESQEVDVPRVVLLVVLFLTPLYCYLLLDVNRFFWFGLILLWLFIRLLRTPALGPRSSQA